MTASIGCSSTTLIEIRNLTLRTENLTYLARINFNHWVAKNPYFSDRELNRSMKAALTLIKGKGFLRNFNPRTSIDYSLRIRAEVSSFDPANPDYDKLLLVFDLIQAWGGQTGRRPYVIKNGLGVSSRQCSVEWQEVYLEGVKYALGDHPIQALSAWRQIDGLGASFSPKHLRFWTDKYPVLDTRISVLLCGTPRLLRNPDGYREFMDMIKSIATVFDASVLDTEKALFAFSQNFFMNDHLVFKKGSFQDETDLDLAKRLSATHLDENHHELAHSLGNPTH